ncbi:MAG TPA: SDR family NAD(P)-dependent oxidoreductase, partial [Solirubrobacteraceae bacterium]|nr:SDR family NAD(P)-dependent oxidoreductase [Solirubrobacteraceae bacterium]
AAAYGPFVDMTPDDYQRTIGVTLLGIVNTTHAALPHLQRSAGSLIVVGSISGRLPTPWLAAYTAAKYGVRGFARTLQIELRSLGIPVNVALIAPGPVDTPFWRRARTTDSRVMPRVLGAYRPEDVADEVMRAIGSARTERTVGGVLAIGALLDALAPNIALRTIGSVAKLGWLRRDDRPPQPADNLAAPSADAQLRIGFRSRPSALGKLRELHHGVGAVLRATASRGWADPPAADRRHARSSADAARRSDEVLGDRAR